MPELPEVETIKNVIEPQIKGLKIGNVTVNRQKIIAHPLMKRSLPNICKTNSASEER